MDNQTEIHSKFRFEQDSKRFHRFQIETAEGIVGTVYVPKNLKPMPTVLTLEYAGKSETAA